ncbi:hypothetical protein QFZ24_005656 [Streptomyces phaeochromogenes]|nr:hypothetical protein [Streptomyces phaeochromogenes]
MMSGSLRKCRRRWRRVIAESVVRRVLPAVCRLPSAVCSALGGNVPRGRRQPTVIESSFARRYTCESTGSWATLPTGAGTDSTTVPGVHSPK